MTRRPFDRSRALVVAALAAACAGAWAAPGRDEEATVRRIRDAVQRGTGLAPDSVEPSTVLPGYYEVRAKGAVAYVDAEARHFVKGPVIDLATGENLSLNRGPGSVPRIELASLPLADAITTVHGKGRRRLAVFVDPNCTYCRSLEPELARLGDVTVHRFVVPVLGPGSIAAARRVWCAADRPAAWRQAVSGAEFAGAARACDTAALDRNLALAKRYGIAATPTLVFPHGERVSAVMPAAEIEKRLAGRPTELLRP